MEGTLDEEVELVKDPETIEKVSEEIFEVLKTKEEANILSTLYKKEFKNVDLTLCINSSQNNNTILTTLVNYNLTRATINFISLLTHLIKSSSDFSNYINQKNTKGYNALLYSAFRGNLEIFNKLMEVGADPTLTNSSGLNALHLASQGNYPNMIVILVEKYNLDINSRDNKGNSALHWAVYKNSRQAVDYLIYYNIDTNLKDNDGETALGIAMSKGNNYLVKRFNEDYSALINKNSEESNNNQDNEIENEIENNNNQNIELSNSSKVIRKNFNELMNKFWGTNSKNMAAFPFLLIIFSLEGMNQIIILKGYNSSFMSLIFFTLFFLSLFFYYVTCKSDPGEASNKYINSLSLLAEQGEDLKNICPWCINSINENTHHCFLCNKCINYQEFHDVYLNNCIGRNNFNLYMNFLFYLSMNFALKLIVSVWGLLWLSKERFRKAFRLIIPQIICTSSFLYFCIKKIREKYKKYDGIFNFDFATLSDFSKIKNLFTQNMKHNISDSSSVSIINSNKNIDTQLSSLENTDRDI